MVLHAQPEMEVNIYGNFADVHSIHTRSLCVKTSAQRTILIEVPTKVNVCDTWSIQSQFCNGGAHKLGPEIKNGGLLAGLIDRAQIVE